MSFPAAPGTAGPDCAHAAPAAAPPSISAAATPTPATLAILLILRVFIDVPFCYLCHRSYLSSAPRDVAVRPPEQVQQPPPERSLSFAAGSPVRTAGPR